MTEEEPVLVEDETPDPDDSTNDPIKTPDGEPDLDPLEDESHPSIDHEPLIEKGY